MEKMKNQTKKGLNAGNLKMIALFCMVIDHIGVAILYPLAKNQESMLLLYFVFRLIGRVAFPLYAFFITEGFFHTRNKLKYALRLLLLAVISEVPFDMVLDHKLLCTQYQNVFFTLLFGLLTIWALDAIGKTKIKRGCSVVIKLLIITVVCFLTEFAIRGDYGAIGVFSIVSIYLTRKNEKVLTVIFFATAIIMSEVSNFAGFDEDFLFVTAISVACFFVMIYVLFLKNSHTKEMTVACVSLTALNSMEAFALIDAFLVAKYNGEKGKINKWFFYFAYPCHLLLLALLCMALKLY